MPEEQFSLVFFSSSSSSSSALHYFAERKELINTIFCFLCIIESFRSRREDAEYARQTSSSICKIMSRNWRASTSRLSWAEDFLSSVLHWVQNLWIMTMSSCPSMLRSGFFYYSYVKTRRMGWWIEIGMEEFVQKWFAQIWKRTRVLWI